MGRNKKLQEIDLALNSLVIFRKLLTNDVMLPLRALLDTDSMDPMIQLRQYTEFISRLYARSTNLTEFIFRLICEDDNFYVRAAASGEEIDEMLEACLQNELAILQRLARIRPHELQKEVSYYGVLPEWKTSDLDFGAEYHARLRDIGKYGFGQFVPHKMFVYRDEMLVPIRQPDPVRLSDLQGFDTEIQKLIANTRLLLAGEPAENVLLCGDAGTGKSAAVKALVNEYADEGLRLIELTQDQLPHLPEIMEQLADNPLKFIIFADDLTVQPDAPELGRLRSVLGGSAAVRLPNTAVYATSMQLPAVCEDPHDPLQALARRFGLRLRFRK
ncbi:MAG: DUF815 domain-containing protein [Oscillospiraceae bacterium]|nr:DUF815 domain-containing protein [Oscillospiraceae bacterium]